MGLIVSVSLLLAWGLSLLGLLPLDLSVCAPIELILSILLRTFLHTGLFVIAHDAMHGNVLPSYPVENRWLGQLALGLYGFLPYQTACDFHRQHHVYPAQTRDPDFCERGKEILGLYVVRWYLSFISNYVTLPTLGRISIGMGCTLLSLILLGHIAIQNIVLFWLLPWVLISRPLFLFGTFLPHFVSVRDNKKRLVKSFYYPPLFSLLICYHFSYHQEHHTCPKVPWYLLPNVSLTDTGPAS
ncbi:MAG: fatty acid desaturase [Cyanobacteria bacterium P01_F01_bin.53]